MALVRASLTSQVIKMTPILPEILTSCPYNCWPLLLRMSVLLVSPHQMALGDAKHRSQVEELFRGVEKGLAQSLFALSAQQGLSIPDTVKVMDFLASNVRLDTRSGY